MERRKKSNIFVQYFTPFGIRQVCDFLMLAGFIVLIVGFCTTQLVTTIGFGIFIVASALALYRTLKIIFSDINRRSPEWRSALINTIIMGVLFITALFGLIWAIAKVL